jgi:cold-inducible RNA-binding protein
MGRKLYVGNLPYSATEQSLREAFAACGTVDSVSVITDRDTGQSKGFAFVEAKPRETRSGGGGGGGGGRGGYGGGGGGGGYGRRY